MIKDAKQYLWNSLDHALKSLLTLRRDNYLRITFKTPIGISLAKLIDLMKHHNHFSNIKGPYSEKSIRGVAIWELILGWISRINASYQFNTLKFVWNVHQLNKHLMQPGTHVLAPFWAQLLAISPITSAS